MIYTDSFLWDWRGKETICGHLFTDGNIEELHEFAQKIGLKREWFQNKKLLKHYDLIGKKMIDKAVKAGAKLISLKEFMEIRKKINEV